MRPIIALAASALLWPCTAAVAQDNPDDIVPPLPDMELERPADIEQAAEPALTRDDLESWLDGFMTYALPRNDIAGAVIVVVRDGEVLLQKGYGYADVEAQKPVDPELTLFRPGSVSKLFTWTAVMQLVEQGKIDLDADVSTYLDFEIPARDGGAVTMRHIMTHTAGFEEQLKDLMGVDADNLSLEAHIKRWVPGRIFPAGVTPAYSNYATALAGYVIERVSGMSFDDYMDENIFEPLGMTHSTFRQPLPAALEEHMSKGYQRASLPPQPFEVVGPAPAGSLSASGADMAKFMIAHLQKGRYGDARILEEQTAEQMHSTPLTILPGVDRMVLGFYEADSNGRRVISHGGDTRYFHSDLNLFIDEGIGLFMSVNSAGTEGATLGLRLTLLQEFADRYLPGEAPEGEVDEETRTRHAAMIAGRYESSRRAETSFLSLLNLAGGVTVNANEDGTITVPLLPNVAGDPIRWREIEPFVWREVGGENLLVADVEDGRVTRFTFEPVSAIMMFEPVPLSKSPGWLLPGLIAALCVFTLTVLAWPTAALVRRYYGARYGLSGTDAKAHRRVRLAALLALALWVAWGVTVSMMMSDLALLSPSLDGWLWTLQILSLVIFPLAAIVGLWNLVVVLKSTRRVTAKIWALLLALSFLVVLWIALAYHQIAFDVNY